MNLLYAKSIANARSSQRGYAVISLLVMLSVMLLFIMANLRYLRDLDRELRLTERQQIHRLQKTAPKQPISMSVTNTPGGETIAIIKR